MAGCDVQTFIGFTPQHFACLLQRAQSSGLNISGTSGTASRGGITIAWSYDASAQVLSVQCTEKPAFLGCGLITAQISDLVNNCMAA